MRELNQLLRERYVRLILLATWAPGILMLPMSPAERKVDCRDPVVYSLILSYASVHGVIGLRCWAKHQIRSTHAL